MKQTECIGLEPMINYLSLVDAPEGAKSKEGAPNDKEKIMTICGCGCRNRTYDLEVMSLTCYLCTNPPCGAW